MVKRVLECLVHEERKFFFSAVTGTPLMPALKPIRTKQQVINTIFLKIITGSSFTDGKKAGPVGGKIRFFGTRYTYTGIQELEN
jgi:hypothetical protein